MSKKEIAILLKFIGWLADRGTVITIKELYEFLAYMQSHEEKKK